MLRTPGKQYHLGNLGRGSVFTLIDIDSDLLVLTSVKGRRKHKYWSIMGSKNNKCFVVLFRDDANNYISFSEDVNTIVVYRGVVLFRDGTDQPMINSAELPNFSNGSKPIDQINKYPHICQSCGGPAYIGFTAFECENGCHEIGRLER